MIVPKEYNFLAYRVGLTATCTPVLWIGQHATMTI